MFWKNLTSTLLDFDKIWHTYVIWSLELEYKRIFFEEMSGSGDIRIFVFHRVNINYKQAYLC